MQRPVCPSRFGRPARLLQNAFDIEIRKRIDARVQPLDLRNMLLRQFEWRYLAFPDESKLFNCRSKCEFAQRALALVTGTGRGAVP